MKHTGKKAIVIGGTTGMGLATAKALVDEGASVMVTGRNPQNLEAARLSLGVRAVRSDLASLDDIRALAALVATDFDQVDLVFVNAGIAELGPFSQVTEQAYDSQFDINAKGAFFTAQHLAPFVKEGGSIVFTTAVTNLTGTAGMSVYSGTKAAVHAFAKVMAAELLPRNIRVNSVSPGFIRTETMGAATLTPEERTALEKAGDEMTPMGRHGTTAEVAAAVLFLAFEATFTTGVEFPVTGGLGLVS